MQQSFNIRIFLKILQILHRSEKMKKLLYIIVNSKPEEMSLEYQYFDKRNSMIKKEDFNKLDKKQQEEVHKLIKP